MEETMGRLAGKVALITGAAQGIGAQIARQFSEQGACVVLGDLNEQAGNDVASAIGETAVFRPMDVTSEADWQQLVETALSRWEQIDVLVNNAGIVHFTAIEKFDLDQGRRVLDINTIAPLLGAKHVTPHMSARSTGSIINISSVDGLRGANGLSVYTASKWALRGLTKSLAFELGARGIRVNSIHPGRIDTPMGNPTGLTEDELRDAVPFVPLQRAGTPDEVAQAALFLASDESNYMTGSELAVDGGWSAGTYNMKLPGAPTTPSK